VKKKFITLVSTFISIVLATNLSNAQTKFEGGWSTEGNWQLLYGKPYSNALPQHVEVSLSPDSLTIISISTGANGLDTIVTHYLKSGQPTTLRSPGGRKEIATITWNDDHTGFTEVGTYYKKDDLGVPEIKITEDWLIGEDGKLSLTRSFLSLINADDKWSAKSLYDQKDRTNL